MTSKASNCWSAADDALFAELVAAHGLDWDLIAGRFPGRTRGACKARHYHVSERASGKPKRLRPSEAKPGARRRVRTEPTLQDPPAPGSAPKHTSLTAAAFGDPLPGRSALDKMRGVSA